jgi:opacity protein-like surface antigen
MGNLKISALVGAALFVAPLGALAADYPEPPVYVPPPVGFSGDWYLKGYIGLAAQHFRGLEHPSFAIPDTFVWLDPGQFDGVPLFGVGVGFRHSDNLRFDLTAEYRAKSAFSALDFYEDADATPDEATNHYTGKKQEILFLANAYYDFNEIHGITPYVGAGIGASYNTIYDFVDTNVIAGGGGWAPTGNKLSLAWALHAGASMQVNERLTLDFGYSFVSLGDAQTGIFRNLDGTCVSCVPMNFRGIYSHDFKVGARWAFGHNKPSYVMAKY